MIDSHKAYIINCIIDAMLDPDKILTYNLYGLTIGDLLKFSISCGFVGLATFIVDVLIYYLKLGKGTSLLGIKYVKHEEMKLSNSVFLCVSWTLGSFLVGGAGYFARIFSAEPTAILTVGIFWPLVFTKIVNSNGVDKSEDEPNDEEEGDPT
jgi:hypothetical protein